jgi:hypothetical protein
MHLLVLLQPQEYYCYPFVPPAPAVATAKDSMFTPLAYYPNMARALPQTITAMTAHPVEPAWWLTDQTGKIWRVSDDSTADSLQLVLDVTALVKSGGEQGLLGLAFMPNFATSKQFLINYTDLNGNTVIAKYTQGATPALTAATAATILAFDQARATAHRTTMTSFLCKLVWCVHTVCFNMY